MGQTGELGKGAMARMLEYRWKSARQSLRVLRVEESPGPIEQDAG